MKICILTDAWRPVWGGGQVHIWEVASRLTIDPGYQVDILVPNIIGTKNYTDGKLRVIKLGPEFKFPALWGRAANFLADFWWMVSNKYDVYHAHSNAAILLPIVKIFHPKSKMLYTIHGAGVVIAGGHWLSSLARKVWNLLVYFYPWDVLVTVARATISGKTAAKKLVVIGNGVDVDIFDRVRSKKDKKYFKILCVARPDPVKGVAILENAIEKVRKKYSNVRLNLISVRKATVADFKKSDLYVLPSLSEGFPIVILEAMAAKLPVVATTVGAVPEIVINGKTGYLIAAGDAHMLAVTIEKAIVNKNLNKMGIAGYRMVKEMYSWDEVAKETSELYKSLPLND